MNSLSRDLRFAIRPLLRDHRPDCEQMVIALIVNSEGFPFSYETFNGNRAGVSTMGSQMKQFEQELLTAGPGCDPKWKSRKWRFPRARRPLSCAARQAASKKRRPSAIAFLLAWRMP
jgi:hypothetical protein